MFLHPRQGTLHFCWQAVAEVWSHSASSLPQPGQGEAGRWGEEGAPGCPAGYPAWTKVSLPSQECLDDFLVCFVMTVPWSYGGFLGRRVGWRRGVEVQFAPMCWDGCRFSLGAAPLLGGAV